MAGGEDMPNLEVSGVRTFVGARHFEDSRDFYVALGWKLNWERDALAELELGGCPLFLQRYYHRDWCENSMLHVTVEDAQAWYEHARTVIEEGSFSGPPRVNPPKEEDYGALVTYIWDPSGVLLHMAQPLGR